MRIEDIKDHRLRQRLVDAMNASDGLRLDLRHDEAGPPSMHPKKIKVPSRRIRQSQKPLLNRLEQEYYDRFLKDRDTQCPVMIQAVRFRLGNGIWFLPDFFTVSLLCASNVAIEVKGPYAYPGALDKLKLAAHQYPWIKWVLAWKNEASEWQEQVVLP